MSFTIREIKLDGPMPVRAGGELKGRLVVDVNTRQNFLPNCWKLYFHGEEQVELENSATRSKTTVQKHVSHSLDWTVLDRQSDGTILPKSNCEIPFSFRVPLGIPGTFEASDPNIGSVKITYHMVAKHAAECQRCPVPVEREPKPLRVQPHFVFSQPHQVQGRCFMPKGQILAGATTQDSVLVPGQEFQLELRIVNESLASIKKIHVALVEHVGCQLPGNQVTKCSISKELGTSDVMVPKALKKKGIVQKLQSAQAQAQTKLSVVLPPVPSDAGDTCSTTLLQVTHYVQVYLGTREGTSDPTFRIPVRIQRGPASRETIPMAVVEPLLVDLDEVEAPLVSLRALAIADDNISPIPVAEATELSSRPQSLEGRRDRFFLQR